ncbi:DUF4304 domain-containing protein [Oceanobacter mangrovi]|uniref:DUF4304 domain-containing protein n=1 Tax=Oceanobacter mangrovi TaxID=2862510 RepID=UPI001C8F1127|nr:DUF4304 domain-containing protein [Oceanobacter mangrovi]
MKREKSLAQAAFDDLLKTSVAPVLKQYGYKKSGENFFKRNDDSSIVINFQSSVGSSFFEKRFFINVGVAFDEICKYQDIYITEKPKEYECSSRGARNRVNTLFSTEPEIYGFSDEQSLAETCKKIDSLISPLAEWLDPISDLPSFITHPWYDVMQGDPGIKVLMHYLLGDKERASQQLDRLVRRFDELGRDKLADRSYWCDKYHMTL